MAKYQLLAGGMVQRDDGACIPPDPANRDYADFLAWEAEGNAPDPAKSNPTPQTILPQDLMAKFTAADMVKIMAAVQGDAAGATSLLWYSMVAQRDPMLVDNSRVKTGWSVLTSILGQDRMNAIASALGVTV